MKRTLFSRLLLVPIGIAIGLLGRQILGPPENEVDSRLLKPYSTEKTDTTLEENLESKDPAGDESQNNASLDPLVQPIEIPVWQNVENSQPLLATAGQSWLSQFDKFSHDHDASFHAHGDELCASGCAASNHPTEKLTDKKFARLLNQFSKQPLSSDSPALEELLYFGPQSIEKLSTLGSEPLDPKRTAFLWKQLQYGHAKVSIRVVDEAGVVRTWLKPTSVPFDRRHVFDMDTTNLQDLVTSGTVKRVGLHHIWIRL